MKGVYKHLEFSLDSLINKLHVCQTQTPVEVKTEIGWKTQINYWKYLQEKHTLYITILPNSNEFIYEWVSVISFVLLPLFVYFLWYFILLIKNQKDCYLKRKTSLTL